MARAVQLARQGEGHVEPNPMVGCVIVKDDQVVGEGWHQEFGGPHAEIVALQSCVASPAGATLYVTLEPCCHEGKTPPCTQAIIQAGIARVVAAQTDPNPLVAGKGILQLKKAGIDVEVGVLEDRAKYLNAPYLRRIQQGRPWIIAKWAMTLDGKIATHAGDSRWISNPKSREIVHRLRGRVDAIMVGAGTAIADDPMLTARPTGPRNAVRVVLDRRLRLSENANLVQTAADHPTLVATGPDANRDKIKKLESLGCRIWQPTSASPEDSLIEFLRYLAETGVSNVLVEGGSEVLGSLFDRQLIDEVHVFMAPILAGGSAAPSPIGGTGVHTMNSAIRLKHVEVENIEGDIYVSGRLS